MCLALHEHIYIRNVQVLDIIYFANMQFHRMSTYPGDEESSGYLGHGARNSSTGCQNPEEREGCRCFSRQSASIDIM